MAATQKRREIRSVEDLDDSYDVLVIGGGVNGLASAWDAALRGLRVAIVEKGDWGSGTSSWSSRLIHGGLKYLEHLEFGLVYEALHDREWLLRRAPHLVKPLPFLMPFYKSNQHNKWILRLGMLIYDVLSFGKSVPNHRALSAAETKRSEPALLTTGLQGAGRYYDAQIAYAERLCIELSLLVREAGGHAVNYVSAERLIFDGARVVGAELRDERSGASRSVRAAVTVNAAGPWIDAVLDGTPAGATRLNGGTKGTHLVIDRFPGGPDDECVYYEAQSDGRQVLVIPWLDRYLIGSTDKRFSGDLDRAQPDEEEVSYILTETNAAFPKAGLDRGSVRFAYTGVRPLPYQPEGDVGKITRKHIVKDHGPAHPGLLTVIGGKLTTFRSLGQDVGARLAKKLGGDRRSHTREQEFPGARLPASEVERRLIAALPDVGAALVRRLVDVYGSRAIDIAELAANEPSLARIVAAGPDALLAAEVVFAVREEQAVHLSDVLARRTMIGLQNDLGVAAIDEVAGLLADELGWDGARVAQERADYLFYIERFTTTEEGKSIGATSPRH